MKTVVYHTLTTGFWDYGRAFDAPGQPKMIGLGAVLVDDDAGEVQRLALLANLPKGHSVPAGTAEYHGVTTEMVRDWGMHIDDVMKRFRAMVVIADSVASYGSDVHSQVIAGSLRRANVVISPTPKQLDLMKVSTGICRIPGRDGAYKFPKLAEAYQHFAREPLVINRDHGGVDIVSQMTDAVVTIYKGFRRYQAEKAARETVAVAEGQRKLDPIP